MTLTFILIGTLYINAANIVELVPSNNGGCSVTYVTGSYTRPAYSSDSCEQIATKTKAVIVEVRK